MNAPWRTLTLASAAGVALPLVLAGRAAAAALLDLPVPARWTWVAEVGGGADPLARLHVASLDHALTAEAAEAAEGALRATMPWLTWSTADSEDDGDLPVASDVVLADEAWAAPDEAQESAFGPDLLAPLWHGLAGGAARVRLTLRFRAPTSGAQHGARGIGSITLSSTSSAASVQAGVLAAALSRTAGELIAVPRRSSPSLLPLTEGRVGRCLAAVSLLHEAWPSRPLSAPVEVVERLAGTFPPHAVVFGGSGLGKTTLLEALVEHRLRAGRTTVVIDPHGDLAARAAVSAAALGRPASCIDFGDEQRPPLWNLTRPPSRSDARAWATDLLDAVQATWPDADAQWFGPVYRRTMFSLLLPLILDPAGPWPLARLHDLAVPGTSVPGTSIPGRGGEAERWRRAVLDRIDDPDVKRDLWEAVRMMDGDREQHARTWLLSKLEPLLQHPGMRRVVDSPMSTVDLDRFRAGTSMFVATPAAELGDEGSTVLSMLVLRWIWSRVRRLGAPEGGLDIVLDEAHRMPVALCREILAEGRKFGVQLRLATQSPSLLSPSLRAALLTNAGTVATMRVGPEDSAILRSRFPDVSAQELCTLPPYRVAVATTTGRTAIGSGPAGRPADGAAVFRRAHRAEVDRARNALLHRLRSDLERWVVEAGGSRPPVPSA